MTLLKTRASSLRRRAESLPKEIERWLRRAEEGERFEKNFSQLQAIDIFMGNYLLKLDRASAEMIDLVKIESPHSEAVLNQVTLVEARIEQAQFIWDYFRTKLEQRFDPEAAKVLLVTDLVAHDCYHAVMKGANSLGIDHRVGLRDYPLVYLLVGHSPVTWPRSWQVKGLDSRMLPVPVIGLPWDQMASLWEMLLLHHEVAHDTDIDLKDPSQEMGSELEQGLVEEGVPRHRARVWKRWMREVLADFLGILLAGPAFAPCLAAYLAGAPSHVYELHPGAPHPAGYLRTLLAARFVQTISENGGMRDYVDPLIAQWRKVYAQPPMALADFVDDFDYVIDRFLREELSALEDADGCRHSLRELIRFGENEFAEQVRVSDCWFLGKEVDSGIPIRHLVGAAFMAAEKRMKSGEMIDEVFASRLSEQMREATLAAAPKGQLPLRPKRSERYLEKLADAWFESPVVGSDIDD